MAKKLRLGAAMLGLAAFTTAACGGGEETENPPVTPAAAASAPQAATAAAPAPARKRTMLEMQIAFEKAYAATVNDTERNVALYAPDVSASIIGAPELRGHEAMRNGARQLHASFTDVKLADSRMWSKGNTLVMESVMTGTARVTGKPFSVAGCDVFTFNDDGLVVADRGYTDLGVLLEQIGAYRGPAPAPALLPLPSAPIEAHVARDDATEQANAASVGVASAAFWKKDDKAYFATFADDATWFEGASNGVPLRDKTYEMAEVAALRKAVIPTALEIPTVLAVEDFTITEQEISFVQKAPYAFGATRIPNMKKKVTVHALEIDQWRDGKVVNSWYYGSTYELATQLGIGPAARKRM